MKKALIIGINEYNASPLTGCVNDAYAMAEVLESHDDGNKNFDCQLLTGDHTNFINKALMNQRIEELFAHEADTALLYFSGHGGNHDTKGGHLVTQELEEIAMNDIIALANRAAGEKRIKEIIIILDCCHSGAIGSNYLSGSKDLVIQEGIAILTASRSSQYAMEVSGSGGIFTSLMVDALHGGAADALGGVNIASAYGYADQALGAWDQRPLMKVNLSKLSQLRKCNPKINKSDLDIIASTFIDPHDSFMLDPSFEDTCDGFIHENVTIFKALQRSRAAGLVEPIGEDHMYDAAMNSKGCKLTALGRYYWQLKKEKRI